MRVFREIANTCYWPVGNLDGRSSLPDTIGPGDANWLLFVTKPAMISPQPSPRHRRSLLSHDLLYGPWHVSSDARRGTARDQINPAETPPVTDLISMGDMPNLRKCLHTRLDTRTVDGHRSAPG